MNLKCVPLYAALFAVSVGCSLPNRLHTQRPNERSSAARTPAVASQIAAQSAQLDPTLAAAIVGPIPNSIAVSQDLIPEIDVPNEPEINSYIRIYNGKRRSCVVSAFHRRKQYERMVESTFEKYNLPAELIHVAMIESNFSPNARSHMGAVGLWQFIAGTARQFGLRVGNRVDERKDVDKATEAAAQYLSSLYSTYGDWSLALAAYNSGEGTVNRALVRGRSRDFFKLARKGHFKRETVDYVSRIMAVTLIHRDINAYAFNDPTPAIQLASVEGR